MKYPLILASGSPRRKQLMEAMGLSFDIIIPSVEENNSKELLPQDMILANAKLKAQWVSERNPNSLVLGADTIVVIENNILNKPKDMSEATDMLRFLSGKMHEVYTGMHLCVESKAISKSAIVTSKVFFKELNNDIIAEYFKKINPLDKAGGYALQEYGDMIIEKVEGSHNNIIGLPTEELEELLEELNG